MSAAISFYAGEGTAINNLAGSGLGFYGDDGFGTSVSVGAYQGRTFITNSAGTAQGPECDNIKWTHANSGVIGQTGTSLNLLNIPNYQATLNVRFTYDTPVNVQNVALKMYDRVSTGNSASGVTVKAAELIHVSTSQTGVGSGDSSWTTFTSNGSGLQSMDLAPNPGVSGLYAGNGSNSTHTDTQHDWFCSISCSPDQIGSRLFAMAISLEYL